MHTMFWEWISLNNMAKASAVLLAFKQSSKPKEKVLPFSLPQKQVQLQDKQMDIYMHRNTHTRVRMHACAHAHTHTHTHSHAHTHRHIHVRAHTHTHTHTEAGTSEFSHMPIQTREIKKKSICSKKKKALTLLSERNCLQAVDKHHTLNTTHLSRLCKASE